MRSENSLKIYFMIRTLCLTLAILVACTTAFAQKNKDDKKPAKKAPKPFRWVNPLPKGDWPDGLKHGTFKSPSMNVDVGYCVYLPPGYDAKKTSEKRFPVVYYLHGGRPGGETKSIKLTSHIDKAMQKGDVPGMIYVFVNGGKVSHYNTPQYDSLGEDVFVKELIPHIDATYRTIAKRESRGLEGFSQGGRGTTRIMFKHPDLFSSCAPGGAGQATEKSISENHGRENENLIFAEGYNTWDLAREYAKNPKPSLKILVHVGTKGFNYENNLEYMKFLTSLKIPYERLIVEGVPHSAGKIYEKRGLELMKFHAANFALLK
jgi:enterochelin esterase-like enzyme